MKFFITGGTGTLGTCLVRKISKNNEVVISCRDNKKTNHKCYNIDIREGKIKDIIKKESPDCVIHTAAITDVDLCETNRKLAYSVNVLGTKNVVEACKDIDACMVYVSTTFVFDGAKKLNSERDPTNPINYYAETKLKGELLVKNSELKRWLIVRPDQIYGWHPIKDNFVTSTLKKLKTAVPFKVFEDWYNHPTYGEDLADIIFTLAKKRKMGIYNTAGETYLNRFEWAKMIAEVFGGDSSLILPAKSSDVGLPAKRPNVHVDLSKIEKVLGRKPLSVREGMELMKQHVGGN